MNGSYSIVCTEAFAKKLNPTERLNQRCLLLSLSPGSQLSLASATLPTLALPDAAPLALCLSLSLAQLCVASLSHRETQGRVTRSCGGVNSKRTTGWLHR